MHRIVSASIALMFVGLMPAASMAVPLTLKAAATTNSSMIVVQGQGWWEQENRGDEPRQKYWGLQRPNLKRYNQLQVEINQLQRQRAQIDARINADIAEQHRILGYR